MHGNIWEWCQDWHGDYPQTAETNPVGGETGISRVLRGGSWFNYAGGKGTRSALCGRGMPDFRYYDVGFRFAPGQAQYQETEPPVSATERGKK